MKKIISFLLLLGIYSGYANHIVGGEMEFITIQPGLYRINLIQYRDETQDENPEADPSVRISLFSNKDNRFIKQFTLPLKNQSEVFYTKPECAISQLKTSRVIYSVEETLDPKEYQDAEGYYLVWERCCRNANIINIVAPKETGQKYIVDIPPLYKGGSPFINSSPVLLKPLSDYACVNQLYYTNFTGTDPDGDSLVYKLAVPLNTSIFDALPPPRPKPNLEVTWASGYSLDNMVPGKQPLRISTKGLLTVNPSTPGLYVFSVIVEEWRNRVKIGQVQRDFQMLVIDGCEPPDPPKVSIEIPGRPDFNPATDILSYNVVDEKCFDFIVTNVTRGETIFFRAEPVNFDQEFDNLFSISSAFVEPGQETIKLTVCAPSCPPIRNAPFIIDLIAGDDSCPLPQMDTLRIMIQVQPPPNDPPVIVPLQDTYNLNEGDEVFISFTATDADNDFLTASLIVPGVEDPEARGFSFEVTSDAAGRIAGQIGWNTDCLVYDFSDRQYFSVGLHVDDKDSCMFDDRVIEWINFNVILPANTSPTITSNAPRSIEVFPRDTISFDLSASDLDGDLVTISISSPDVDVTDYGAVFTSTDGLGAATGQFHWILGCDLVNQFEPEEITLNFIADDQDKCKVKNSVTLTVIPHLDLINQAPYFSTSNDPIRLHVNEPFSLLIEALDQDVRDSIELGFHPSFLVPNSESLEFSPVAGVSSVSSLLQWTPECNLLDQGEKIHRFDLNFLVSDNSCSAGGFKSLRIPVEIYEDEAAFNNFLPPNAFSPNGDGINDTYSLTNLINEYQNLPRDLCENEFEYFSVFDRSGRTIFTTTHRDFVFTGNNVPEGTYFYVVIFTKNEYKGFIQIIR